jgi:hypothetical protein
LPGAFVYAIFRFPGTNGLILHPSLHRNNEIRRMNRLNYHFPCFRPIAAGAVLSLLFINITLQGFVLCFDSHGHRALESEIPGHCVKRTDSSPLQNTPCMNRKMRLGWKRSDFCSDVRFNLDAADDRKPQRDNWTTALSGRGSIDSIHSTAHGSTVHDPAAMPARPPVDGQTPPERTPPAVWRCRSRSGSPRFTPNDSFLKITLTASPF